MPNDLIRAPGRDGHTIHETAGEPAREEYFAEMMSMVNHWVLGHLAREA